MSKLIVDAVNRIAAGSSEKITLADPTVEKEWAYARDVAEGMFALLDQDAVHKATIGTGIAYSINDFLVEVFRQAGLPLEEHVEFLSEYRSGCARLVSDPGTMTELSWTATTSLEQLVGLMLA